ncbi:MAG TPA: isochorismatase family cysteine hydrolase [Burkholderiaceae bacterium]|nr:isochorismatase family cysteine hydrolase [Burkholderiaceae bacterium]
MKIAQQQAAVPRSAEVLLLVDVVSSFRFPGGRALARQALPAARAIERLKKALQARGVPAVYANDNEGRWQPRFDALEVRQQAQDKLAAEIAACLAPGPEDLFLLKPRHSAFLGTPLDLVLKEMGARRLVLVGFSTDFCIQFTAMEAYLRGYELRIPGDCTAALSLAHKRASLAYMRRVLKADTRPSTA